MNKFKEFILKQEIKKEVKNAKLDLKDNWFDSWHHHLNPFFEGQEIENDREFFTEQHFLLFKKYLNQICEEEFEVQCFLLLNTTNFEDDAVYVHSENPHVHEFSKYPKKIKALKKMDKKDLPEYIKKYVDGFYVCYRYKDVETKAGGEVLNYDSIFIETKEQSESSNSIYLKGE